MWCFEIRRLLGRARRRHVSRYQLEHSNRINRSSSQQDSTAGCIRVVLALRNPPNRSDCFLTYSQTTDTCQFFVNEQPPGASCILHLCLENSPNALWLAEVLNDAGGLSLLNRHPLTRPVPPQIAGSIRARPRDMIGSQRCLGLPLAPVKLACGSFGRPPTKC